MPENIKRTECERCGTCCQKGGPALHIDDKDIITNKFLNREALITIRKGEPVFPPGQSSPDWAAHELIKIKGTGNQWSCIFYDQSNNACSIYQHRPLECILLKCWDTADLEAVAGINLLSRSDIILSDEPVVKYIQMHEQVCSLDILAALKIDKNVEFDKNSLAELNDLVNKDLALRSEAISKLNISLDLELFYFGRPLFKILARFGLVPKELAGKVIMTRA